MSRRKGFTLVELLVVIGIIALLISILLPTLNKAREAAVAVQCSSNMKQVMMGLIMYAEDNRGSFPYSYDRHNVDGVMTNIFWPGLLAGGGDTTGYLGNPMVFYCPNRVSEARYPEWIDRVRSDPNPYNPNWNYVSYAANLYGAMPQYVMGTEPPYSLYRPIKLGASGASSSDFMILMDCFYPLYLNLYGAYGIYSVYPGPFTPWVHGRDAVNVAYLDGHIAGTPSDAIGWNATTKTWKPGYTVSANIDLPPWYALTFTYGR